MTGQARGLQAAFAVAQAWLGGQLQVVARGRRAGVEPDHLNARSWGKRLLLVVNASFPGKIGQKDRSTTQGCISDGGQTPIDRAVQGLFLRLDEDGAVEPPDGPCADARHVVGKALSKQGRLICDHDVCRQA